MVVFDRRPVDVRVENNWNRVSCNISTDLEINLLDMLESSKEEIINISSAGLLVSEQGINISSKDNYIAILGHDQKKKAHSYSLIQSQYDSHPYKMMYVFTLKKILK